MSINMRAWNEKMFKICGDTSQRSTHPNIIIRFAAKQRLADILHLLKTNQNDRILDIGCGSGYVLSHINAAKFCVGIDYSRYALNEFRKKIKNNNTHLIEADAQFLPIKPYSFNKIICADVLEHIAQPQRTILEIARISGDDTTSLFILPNDTFINRFKKVIYKLRKLLLLNEECYTSDLWHLHVMPPQLFRSLIHTYFKIEVGLARPNKILPYYHIYKCLLQR